MSSCFDVASYFIELANSTGSFISNLKLQKLVYYAQAWHLALKGESLFDEDFQAWVHGPVIPALYNKYKEFAWHPIDEKVDKSPIVDEPTKTFLGEVADAYFADDAYELERMSHSEEPWLKARAGLAPDQSSTAVIEKSWMKEFFGTRAQDKQN